jgi:hypothetical protein
MALIRYESQSVSSQILEEAKDNQSHHMHTHAGLARVETSQSLVQSQIDQTREDLHILGRRNTRTINLLEAKVRKQAKSSAATTPTEFCKTYWLPVGFLEVRYVEESLKEPLDGLAEGDQSVVEFTFMAPKWLAPIGFTASVTGRFLLSNFPNLTLSLTPFTMNTNPLLTRALLNGDVGQVQRMFKSGEAHPSDHVLALAWPMPLLDVQCHRRSQ